MQRALLFGSALFIFTGHYFVINFIIFYNELKFFYKCSISTLHGYAPAFELMIGKFCPAFMSTSTLFYICSVPFTFKPIQFIEVGYRNLPIGVESCHKTGKEK